MAIRKYTVQYSRGTETWYLVDFRHSAEFKENKSDFTTDKRKAMPMTKQVAAQAADRAMLLATDLNAIVVVI